MVLPSRVLGLVLSYDQYRPVQLNLLAAYRNVWPEAPFYFHIPYQNADPQAHARVYGFPVSGIRAPAPIQETMDALLDKFTDEDWVYWCMDDRYPVALDVPAMNEITHWVLGDNPAVDGILCTRSPRDWSLRGAYLWRHRIRSPGGRVFLRKKHYGSIWSHQFLRVKVLRALFAEFPRQIKQAKEMDYHLFRAKLPRSFRLYVARESLGLFAESASRGALTANCVESMRANGIQVPDDFAVVPERIIQNGDRPGAVFRRARDLVKFLVRR